MRKINSVPVFPDENTERNFWSKNDLTDFADWNHSKKESFPNLKPTLKTISIRLSESMINDLKILANKNDVPYQSLLKIFLSERIKKEFARDHSKTKMNV